MTIFELGLAFDEDLRQCPKGQLKGFTLKECCIKCEDMEARLKTRCTGLLEVQGYQRTFRNRVNSIVYKWNGKVQYLHRTTRDFLESPEEWKAITRRTSRTDFNAHLALFRSYVLLLGFPGLGERDMPRIVELTMLHARHYQDSRSDQDLNLSLPWLDALDRTMLSRNTAWPRWPEAEQLKECLGEDWIIMQPVSSPKRVSSWRLDVGYPHHLRLPSLKTGL